MKLRNIVGLAIFGIACVLIGMAGNQRVRDNAAALVAGASEQPAVWNHVYPPDVTLAIAEIAAHGGKITLHLGGIHADANIDNVQVFMLCTVPDPSGSAYEAKGHAGSLIFESAGYDGDKTIDVTEKFRQLAEYAPDSISDFKVAFIIVPRNRGVRLTEQSFDVKETYFEVFGSDGKPIKQPHKERVDTAIHQSGAPLGPAPFKAP